MRANAELAGEHGEGAEKEQWRAFAASYSHTLPNPCPQKAQAEGGKAMIDRFNQWAADGGPLEPQFILMLILVVAAACIALWVTKR